MVDKVRSYSTYFSVLIFTLLITGCGGPGTVKNMQVTQPDRVVTKPDKGKSMVIFMRPSGIAYAVQSSVFEIIQDRPSLAGILAAQKQLPYQLDPGKHLFMVIGESADFMSAELEANKTYYAFVTPRAGLWKARFSLKPIHLGEFDTDEFKECMKTCEWVEKNMDSDIWASSNMGSIQSKYTEYYSDWMNKSVSARPALLPQDGK